MLENKKAFSIIEIIIGIFIFSLWITSIYMLISSTLNMDIYNRDQIIAWNLAREGIELVRNIRDSNYNTYHKWDQLNPRADYNDPNNFFKTGSYYKIENNFSDTANFPIKVEDISVWFWEGSDKINTSMQIYNICLDTKNRYTYDCLSPWNLKTPFYRYIKFDELRYNDWWTTKIVDDAFKVTSKVIWTTKWYHEFEINTIIADWKRL